MRFIIFTSLVLIAFPVFAQISPGDLTTAHSHLEGMSNCTKCHEIGEAVTDFKCLDCHKEIKEMRSFKRVYHSSQSVLEKNCVECHSEHHGRNFEMKRFDKKNFDHTLTGFRLTGKHSVIDCAKCHTKELIEDNEIKKRANTFWGLTTSCSGCHEDYHQKTLSDKCENCHDTEKFKPAPFFNHNNSKFHLTGAHKKTDCGKCHKLETRNNKEFRVFRGISFSGCVSCHQDIHQGKFGNNCEECHSTESFHKIGNKEKFDHSKTNFKLIGKHKNVECKSCHTLNFQRVVAHDNCTDCHEDYHKGQLIKTGEEYDCNLCHNENSFIPSLYSITDHELSQYKLTGNHLAVPCISCHKTSETWSFRLKHETCRNCHDNVHGNSISRKYLSDDNCSDCHKTEGWHSIIFDHDRTKFQLLGKHKNTPCSGCHNNGNEKDISKYVFAGLSMSCQSCHTDPHFGQFSIDNATNCNRCHESENWQPVKFDHAQTKFPLQGAHQKVNCEKCHIHKKVSTGEFVQYKFRSTDCAFCHNARTKEQLIPKGE